MTLFRLMDTEAVIINEVVINEVRSRECLWNPRNVYYKNKTKKYKAWEEVSVAVLPKYTTCSEDDKKRIVRAVQSRWQVARDAYMKCRLTEGKKPTHQTKPNRYIYNKLKFLEHVRDIFVDRDEGVNNRALNVEEDTNCLVGENSASQSPSTVIQSASLTSPSQMTDTCDDDDNEASDEIMDFEIDIHDDFKERINDLQKKNDSIGQECLPGTSSQNNGLKGPLATADVTKPTTSALQTDDQLFFNSLAPFIIHFDTHQKRKLRSEILKVVKKVGKSGPVNIKQGRKT